MASGGSEWHLSYTLSPQAPSLCMMEGERIAERIAEGIDRKYSSAFTDSLPLFYYM